MTNPGLRARLDAWRARRLDPLAFTLDGVRYTVPDQPARAWVLGILSPEPADLLLDVLDPTDAEDLWDAATDPDDDVTPDLLHRIGQTLLGRVSGRPWWQARMLLSTLAADWDSFIGVARDRGLGDPLDWPVEDLCAWIYLRLTQHAKKEDRARIDADLARPPRDLLADDDGDDDDDDAAPAGWDEAGGFLALAAQAGAARPT